MKKIKMFLLFLLVLLLIFFFFRNKYTYINTTNNEEIETVEAVVVEENKEDKEEDATLTYSDLDIFNAHIYDGRDSFSLVEVEEDGEYTTKEEVASYIYYYSSLPSNYITKSEASKLGWVANEGNLWEVSDHKSIGGDSFGNREGYLPSGKYYECDIDYEGGYRNAYRIIYSNNGWIFYTNDHYETFELLVEGN